MTGNRGQVTKGAFEQVRYTLRVYPGMYPSILWGYPGIYPNIVGEWKVYKRGTGYVEMHKSRNGMCQEKMRETE